MGLEGDAYTYCHLSDGSILLGFNSEYRTKLGGEFLYFVARG